jgi:hypothetical protein
MPTLACVWSAVWHSSFVNSLRDLCHQTGATQGEICAVHAMALDRISSAFIYCRFELGLAPRQVKDDTATVLNRGLQGGKEQSCGYEFFACLPVYYW